VHLPDRIAVAAPTLEVQATDYRVGATPLAGRELSAQVGEHLLQLASESNLVERLAAVVGCLVRLLKLVGSRKHWRIWRYAKVLHVHVDCGATTAVSLPQPRRSELAIRRAHGAVFEHRQALVVLLDLGELLERKEYSWRDGELSRAEVTHRAIVDAKLARSFALREPKRL
jgi:hypothetical protein